MSSSSMCWEKLMSKKRLCRKASSGSQDSRTEFQKDYDRICFSSAFRRLQDKTQVFPLPGNDYVRTRLTHSLECSCVGRSLGTMVGEYVINNKLIDSFYSVHDFGAVVAAACLAHDIGNPPFGHTGEDALRHWTCNSPAGKHLINNLSCQQQKNDFSNFEGNAQGFRLLARIQSPANPGGMQLTSATLATFTKYPRSSFLKHKHNNSKGKFGFFADDTRLFSKVAKETGLIPVGKNAWARHPLAFLVEAADDICYHVVDIEDGYKLGCLSYDEAIGLLKPISKKRLLTSLNDKELMEYMRATAVGNMVKEVAKQFVVNHNAIMSGSFRGDLTKETDSAVYFNKLKHVAKSKVYTNRNVVEIEAAGFNVLGTLMSIFYEAIEYAHESNVKNISVPAWPRTILKLIPEGFIGKNRKPNENLYKRAIRIFDYVSGMTDSYAVSVYKKIQGISLSN